MFVFRVVQSAEEIVSAKILGVARVGKNGDKSIPKKARIGKVENILQKPVMSW